MSTTSASNGSSRGIGLGGAVFIVFLILKLCHVIDWSWWWVTCPLWGMFAIFAAILVVSLLVAGIAALGLVVLEKFEK